MIDTHTHLNFQAFAHDWQEVVERAIAGGVVKMIVVGTDIHSSKKAIELANQHQALFAAVGIHPHHVRRIAHQELEIKRSIEQIAQLATQPKVVAIGEVGLDYHEYKVTRSSSTALETGEEQVIDKDLDRFKKLQKILFREQVQLALQLHKPLILHSREAADDVLEMLKPDVAKAMTGGKVQRTGELRGVFHCFEGSKKYLKKILAAGFYVSFTGNITYVPDRAAVACLVPLERLLLETDCPYMSPDLRQRQERHAGQALRSEPRDVKIIGQKHADDRMVSFDQVTEQTSANATTLFGF